MTGFGVKRLIGTFLSDCFYMTIKEAYEKHLNMRTFRNLIVLGIVDGYLKTYTISAWQDSAKDK